MNKETVKKKLAIGKQTLEEYGFEVDVTPEDLILYFQATTFYDTSPLEEVLKNPFLVIHELVELHELKKRGLKITKDIIVNNIDTVYEDHLIAAEVELYIAYKLGALSHIRNRIRDIENWLEDPLLPKKLYDRCYELLKKAKNWVESN